MTWERRWQDATVAVWRRHLDFSSSNTHIRIHTCAKQFVLRQNLKCFGHLNLSQSISEPQGKELYVLGMSRAELIKYSTGKILLFFEEPGADQARSIPWRACGNESRPAAPIVLNLCFQLALHLQPVAFSFAQVARSFISRWLVIRMNHTLILKRTLASEVTPKTRTSEMKPLIPIGLTNRALPSPPPLPGSLRARCWLQNLSMQPVTKTFKQTHYPTLYQLLVIPLLDLLLLLWSFILPSPQSANLPQPLWA